MSFGEPIAAGFFQAPGTPSSAEPSSVILWALGGVVFLLSVLAGVVKILDSRRENDRTAKSVEDKEKIAKLETKLEEREKKIDDLQALVVRLGSEKDAAVAAKERDAKRMAQVMLSLPYNEGEAELDIPTGVHHFMDLVPPERRKQIDQVLKSYTDSSEPPIPRPPNLPRIKQKSRPDR